MSRENLDLAVLMYDAFNRRDLDAALALIDDQVEIEPRLVALEGCYRGHEGVRRWWSDLLDFLPDYIVDADELHDLGDVTLARIRGRAHGASSAAPVDETWWQSISWRDGRCTWWHNSATDAEALTAIGLRHGDRMEAR